MKRIGLLSDTHSHLDTRLTTHFASCDEIWHAGDVGNKDVIRSLEKIATVRGVYGNIDGTDIRAMFPLHNKFRCEELEVWITHIGGYPGAFPVSIQEELIKDKTDLFICGHSHILKIMRDPSNPKLLHMNPGASGIEGFHKFKTAIRFEVNKKTISKVEVIELGLRGAMNQ